LTLKVKELSFSMEDKDNILVKSIIERKSYNLEEEKIPSLPTKEFLGLFSPKGFMLIPIHSENRALGLLVVDNLITKNKILEEDRVALETFANQAAAQIENIILQQELKIKMKELEHTAQLLRENQNYLLQAERWVDIGKLATTVAHEVKTPLVAIGGFAHRALKKAKEGKLISGELEIILKETQRLESITSEILDYSKVTRLNYEKMDLNLLIKDALEVLKDKLKYNDIKLKIRLSADAFVVEIDSKRIKQVLFNLIENALEAMPQGGVLTVWTRKKENLVLFEIADTGGGISQEHMDKLYIPFFTTKPQGSGLGLSVSKKIISDHSGYIEVKSEINKGTKFTVYLPFSRAER
ncbi:MAG: ATP-binding protein, partial [candidate division Zixibacteria bacterium]|nr:ATP-binding protein [candidate division Zixibacteria bacterium]